MRLLAKDNVWSQQKDVQFQQLLKKAADQQPTVSTLTNAYQHVWEYFKKICSKEEKQTYLQLLQSLTPENDHLGPFL